MRLRIPIGQNTEAWIVAAIFFVLFTLGTCDWAKADTFPAPEQAVLPFYNGDNYSTQIVILNKTTADLTQPLAADQKVGPVLLYIIPAHSFFRAPFGGTGLGIQTVTVTGGLEAYSEIKTPHGAVIRKGPLQPVTSATFYDLLTRDNWNAGVFIGALSDTVASLSTGASAFIPGGTAVVLPAGASIVTVTNTQGGMTGLAPVYAFPYSNHHITGSLVP